MHRLEGRAVVAQGGGPTAVINQSLAGVVLEARKYPFITQVYGARFGVRGIVSGDFLDLSQASTHNLEMVGIRPSSALGSTRDKPDAGYCARIKDYARPLMGLLPQADRLNAPPVGAAVTGAQTR